jgi:hypothetical protein
MFDGNGNWTSDFSAQADRDNGIKILASRFDSIFIADIKESFENCLTKDGQIAPIGNFNMGGQKITNLNNGVNDNDAVNMSQLNNTISSSVSNLLSSLYPVGSIYIGTQSTCPLATLISGSTWAKIGTSITTDVTIPSSIAVYGNGKTLGLTLNNSSNYGLSFGMSNSWALRLNTGFGSNINSSVSETSTTVNKALGITNKTNGDSGIVAKSDSITKTSITVNIWQRTA